MSFLLSFLFLLLFVTPIRADVFCYNGDSAYNMYAQTTALSVGKLPKQEEMLYESGDIFGESTEHVLNSYTISDLAQSNHMQRFPNVLDRVSVPPGAEIDVVYFFLNYTAHDVGIMEIIMFLSKENSEDGDWTKILDIEESEFSWGETAVLFSEEMLFRSGFLKRYPGLGLVPYGHSGALLLDTFKMSNPIEVKDFKYEGSGGLLDFTVVVANRSNEDQNNLILQHGGISLEFSIPAKDKVTLKYTLNSNNLVENSSFEIHNPNSRTECIALGSHLFEWNKVSAVTLLSLRTQGWVHGAYVQPVAESFCITRIPHTSVFKFAEDNSENDTKVEEKESSRGAVKNKEFVKEVVPEETLGVMSEEVEISILPKTGKIY